jgi:hypothetical protein
MMLQFKRILFFVLFSATGFPVVGSAQTKLSDANPVRGADAFDELFPKIGPEALPLSFFVRDSISFKTDYNLRELRTWNVDTKSKGEVMDTAHKMKMWSYTYVFDKESRMISTKDSSLAMETQTIVYLTGTKISKIISSGYKGNNPDTLFYSYDRAGRLSGVCDHIHFRNLDTISCAHFLYDNKGRLLVAENIKYKSGQGTFTYEYNADGKLVKRKFLDVKNGTVLFTDSLSYDLLDKKEDKIHVKHLLQAAPFSAWKMVDEAIIKNNSNKILQYTSYAGEHAGADRDVQPGWTAVYTYDSLGRKLLEMKTDSTGAKEEKVSYVWGTGTLPDSVIKVSYRLKDGVKNATIKTINVTTYDANGRVAGRDFLYFTMSDDKKQNEFILKRKIEKKFEWKKL